MKLKIKTIQSKQQEVIDPTDDWPKEALRAAIKEGDESGDPGITSLSDYQKWLAKQRK